MVGQPGRQRPYRRCRTGVSHRRRDRARSQGLASGSLLSPLISLSVWLLVYACVRTSRVIVTRQRSTCTSRLHAAFTSSFRRLPLLGLVAVRCFVQPMPSWLSRRRIGWYQKAVRAEHESVHERIGLDLAPCTHVAPHPGEVAQHSVIVRQRTGWELSCQELNHSVVRPPGTRHPVAIA